MRLTEFVVKDAILPQLQADSKQSAIRQMVGSLKNCGKIRPADEEAIISAILKREELGSTGIGRGVAVPHTKHPSADAIISTVAICHEGLDFESLDGESVYILFLLISPPDRPGDHLRGLETITRHLKNDDFCSFIRQATTTQAVWDLLQEADESHI
ncbi:PTS sugar transporter subunit IIA [Planctomicrobium sp. SH661]|uniref:PTS sugar transporter subunit IIA n=1 Tax=Planctomicrobium sp. SH661 TaxID=3448124 RepID=UPI003F5C599F